MRYNDLPDTAKCCIFIVFSYYSSNSPFSPPHATLNLRQFRDYEWQVLHEQSEREDMYNEELDQTEFDRFWGLDLFIQIQNKEEMRLRKMYAERVTYLNSMMAQTRAVLPAQKTYSCAKIGTLPEDDAYDTEQQRRTAVIRKLKAEEVRTKLKIRLPMGYS